MSNPYDLYPFATLPTTPCIPSDEVDHLLEKFARQVQPTDTHLLPVTPLADFEF